MYPQLQPSPQPRPRVTQTRFAKLAETRLRRLCEAKEVKKKKKKDDDEDVCLSVQKIVGMMKVNKQRNKQQAQKTVTHRLTTRTWKPMQRQPMEQLLRAQDGTREKLTVHRLSVHPSIKADRKVSKPASRESKQKHHLTEHYQPQPHAPKVMNPRVKNQPQQPRASDVLYPPAQKRARPERRDRSASPSAPGSRNPEPRALTGWRAVGAPGRGLVRALSVQVVHLAS
ncbi:hypothetical protein IWX49DRAFT_575695 [Phyllosticta citricarpa]|uniref:Uncharacterized protein n=1 Tax=Phyllosticta citricarpa TaxID=55181 RepID=A0ABR1MNK8_9PEZI